jgi:hypothetical protein
LRIQWSSKLVANYLPQFEYFVVLEACCKTFSWIWMLGNLPNLLQFFFLIWMVNNLSCKHKFSKSPES